MSQTCAITSCKRPSCALCHCCQQNVCLPHLKEHQDSLISQLNPFVDEINMLGDRLKAVNDENIIGDARQKLEQWRIDSYTKIDDFFNRKCQELDRCVAEKLNKQRGEIDQIRSKVSELIREQYATRHDLDLLTSTIRNLEREMNKIEETSLNVKNQSLLIDDNWIIIEELGKHRFDLSTFPPVYKSIEHIFENSLPLASNDHFLLMHQKPNLYLLDRDLTVVKYVLWNHDNIYDMCWSSVLDRFIVIDENNIFLINQNTMLNEIFPSIARYKWLHGACSDSSLFLSTYEFGSSIMEYNLSPSIQLVKHWKSAETCQNDELICQMRYNNKTLALVIIKPLDKTARIELRNSNTLDRLSSLPLDGGKVQKLVFSCCLFNNDEWLITDYGTGRLLQITKQGQVKSTCVYQSRPLFVIQFGSDMLVISTDTSLNFHKL